LKDVDSDFESLYFAFHRSSALLSAASASPRFVRFPKT
jgi:hypothetical protein